MYKKGIVSPSTQDTITFKKEDLIPTEHMLDGLHASNTTIQVRDTGDFANKAIFLNSKYTWTIITDSDGMVCLVPTKKV